MRLILLALGAFVAWRIAEENSAGDRRLLPAPARTPARKTRARGASSRS
jgi:hypothetical protein